MGNNWGGVVSIHSWSSVSVDCWSGVSVDWCGVGYNRSSVGYNWSGVHSVGVLHVVSTRIAVSTDGSRGGDGDQSENGDGDLKFRIINS